MASSKTLNIYNLAKIGVDVDSDNLHVPIGAFRTAQNLHRDLTLKTAESVVNRKGLRDLNVIALGTGPVLGGIIIPAFEAGNGVSTLFLGFGD